MSQEQRSRGSGIVILLGAVAGAGALAAWFFRRQARGEPETPRALPYRTASAPHALVPEPPEVIELGPETTAPEPTPAADASLAADGATAEEAAEVEALATLAETAPDVDQAEVAPEHEPVAADEPLAPEAELAEAAAEPQPEDEETLPVAETAAPADVEPVPLARTPVEGEVAEAPPAPDPDEIAEPQQAAPADEAPIEGEPLAEDADEPVAPEAALAVDEAVAQPEVESEPEAQAEPVTPQEDAASPAPDDWTTSTAAFSDLVAVDAWSTLPLSALQDLDLTEPSPAQSTPPSEGDSDFERLIAEVEAAPPQPSTGSMESVWEPVAADEPEPASMDDMVRNIFGAPSETESGSPAMPDADAVRRLGEVLGEEDTQAPVAEAETELPADAPAGDDLTTAIEQLFEEADRSGQPPPASVPSTAAPLQPPTGGESDDDVVRSAFGSLLDDPGATAQVQRPVFDRFDDRATVEITSPGRAPSQAEPSDPQATQLLEEGNAFFNVGQYQLAIQRYTEALGRDDELVAAFYNRANAFARTERYDEARQDYDRAVALVPDDADTLNNRGMVHLYQARFEEALADFERALAIAPGDVTVRVNRGLTRLQLGRPDEALEDFRAGVERAPNDPAAHYGAAQASTLLGQRDEAVRSLERVFSLEPEYVRDAAGDPMLRGLDSYEPFHRLLRTYGAGG